MKKLLIVLLILMALVIVAMPVLAETFLVPEPVEVISEVPITAYISSDNTADEVQNNAPPDSRDQPWTWAYLATIAGDTAATLLIVQYTKAKLDRVWKLPTRLYVYVIALIIMIAATGFTTGITPENLLLAVLNSFLVAMAAYGGYELTFAKVE